MNPGNEKSVFLLNICVYDHPYTFCTHAAPISIPTTVFTSLFISFHIFIKFHNLKLLYELIFLLE